MAWGEHKEEDFEEIEEGREKELEDIGFDLSTHSDSEKKYFSEQLNSSEDVFEKENEGDKTYRKPSEKSIYRRQNKTRRSKF